MNKYFYKRRLPHYQPIGYVYFITFRLANSLPKYRILELIEERERYQKIIAGMANEKSKKEKYYTFQREYFLKYEHLLDNPQSGPTFLKKPKIAEIVNEAIIFRDKKVFDLFAHTIMPNHVHMVFKPIIKDDESQPKYHVTKILQSLKSNTAIKINAVLKRKGQFWHKESYDHVVRGEKELKRIINYIVNNPVKAGLVDHPFKYSWTYLNYEYF